ncbi:PREDICTED: putative ribonuclease H protein At1g65750-like [Fragaria vesca subsp. vesca]
MGPRNLDNCLSQIEPSISDSQNSALTCPFSVEEVQRAVKQMGNFKAPGPNGFPGRFYHQYWEVVRDNINYGVARFQRGEANLSSIRRTNIVLIPKIPLPETNAFVLGRQIQDNLIVAHEVYHYLKLKKASSNHEMALKLDMNKAYDRVEWDFLEATLLKFGFEPREILIKLEAMVVPSYPMAIFLMPGTLCKAINSDIANFWWGYSGSKPKIHFRSWDSVCKSKSAGGIGFKDLAVFNKAFLGKQCWRLIKNPNSLWCRVLKGRYFENSNFVHAKKGSRPSWVWNSLLAGQDTITSNAFWQVRNRQSIEVWKDRWVPNSIGGSIIPIDTSNRFTPLLVAEVIDENREWQIDHLKPFLRDSDFNSIKAIPIGAASERDVLVWPHSKSENYSVRSGYYKTLSAWVPKASIKASTSHKVDPHVWKIAWGSKLAPKVSNFTWKALANALPTCENLHKRNIGNSPLCKICGLFPETIEHCLLLCEWTELVWFGSLAGYSLNKQSITTLEKWLLETDKKGAFLADDKQFCLQLILWHLWEIWKHRYEIVMSHGKPNPKVVIEKIKHNFGEWGAAQVSNLKSLNMTSSQSASNDWCPPPNHVVKVNMDGAWDDQTKISGIGIVIRNHRGACLAGASLYGKYNSTIEMEAEAVVRGLQLAKRLRFQSIVVEGDCYEVFSAIKSSI